MALRVDVLADPAGAARPPAGTPVHVQLRDTSLADAPARVIARAETEVRGGEGRVLASVELPEVAAGPAPLTVWAHAEVGATGRVSKGDYVTTRAHPVPSPEQRPAALGVSLRRVG